VVTDAATQRIPLSEPLLEGNEWRYVKECLDTGWISTAGRFVDRFERELEAETGAAHVVATATGTAALHAALLALGVRPGDEVIVSSLTFIAPVNAIRYCGAWPVFIDAEPEHWQMDVKRVEEFLAPRAVRTDAGLTDVVNGRRIAALLPVHILGHPCELDGILALARKYGLAVIEDATESLGATYRGRFVGHHGDAGCLSFNGNKTITTGGGGAVLTNSTAVADALRHLTTTAKVDPVEFIHDEVGYNYRLTNLQAALGCAQLEGLAERLRRKRLIADRYRMWLKDVPGIRMPEEAPWARSSWWLSSIVVDAEHYGMDSRQLMRALAAQGVDARPLWQPIHRSPAHADVDRVECPVADRLHRDVLNLPSSAQLREDEQERVVDVIRRSAR
jgi:perosamine synthetase